MIKPAAPPGTTSVPVAAKTATTASSPSASDFSVLAQTAATDVPSWVSGPATDPEIAATESPAVSEARAVHPNGDISTTWYVIAGSGGLCLAMQDGGGCNSTANALAGKFVFSSGNEVIGVVPNAVTSVSVTGTSGIVTAKVVDNVYAATVPGFSAVTLSGADGTQTLPLG
ncbi:MAG TPA: hypothetical protein VHX88_20725 [Solirubrobacteraceae bacterium]|jgi:hypothetical protein|nr:hypothetical protein [Solirubrobacteraceae bacterium]